MHKQAVFCRPTLFRSRSTLIAAASADTITPTATHLLLLL